MTATKTHAFWDISLDCDCPNCKEYVNLLDYDDFWHGRKFEACENHTDRTRGVDVVCPECGHEFECDLEY